MVITHKQSIRVYELLEVTGKGAYGVVYRAKQPFVDRDMEHNRFPLQWVEE